MYIHQVRYGIYLGDKDIIITPPYESTIAILYY